MTSTFTASTPVEEVAQQGSAARVVLTEDLHISTLGELANSDAGLLHRSIISRGYTQKTAIETVRRLGAILRDNNIQPRSFSWLSAC